MWGAENVVWERFDMIAEWSARARTVTGVSVPSGHYLAEEAPEITGSTLAEFFS
jgi:haloacetate dehalogenase